MRSASEDLDDSDEDTNRSEAVFFAKACRRVLPFWNDWILEDNARLLYKRR